MASSPDRPPAVIYAAKSTEDEHGSILTQLADCRTMAERETDVVAEYQDEAASAFKGDRGPGLAAALDHVERIKGTLYVQHSDRLARGDGKQARHLIEICLRAIKSDFRLRSVQDPATFDNLVMAAVMGERNTEDSRRKSLATKAGKRRAWERGEFGGGPVPDGFERVGDDLRLDPHRIDVIRLAGELADQGCGDPSIARELNRRGHRTKGGGAWTRRRVQDLLGNAIYYGGIPWRRASAEEEINWDTSYPAPWAREDFERRRRGYRDRDLAKGSDRRPGRPHVNHALAGLATCARCLEDGRIEVMRPITSTYRRKDGSRKRTYVCRHVHGCTSLCDAPPIDAKLVDTHVVNELQRYLGDFEAWRDQLLSGYASERQRLEREVDSARADTAKQEQICERHQMAIGIADTPMEMKVATQAAARAQERLTRCQTRLEAAERALTEVPTEAPADAMLDFYNELRAAVRGRLEGANTIARVNDDLRDIFEAFILSVAEFGVCVVPVMRTEGLKLADVLTVPMSGNDFSEWVKASRQGELSQIVDDVGPITPPLRQIHTPSPQLANAHGYRFRNPNLPASAASQA